MQRLINRSLTAIKADPIGAAVGFSLPVFAVFGMLRVQELNHRDAHLNELAARQVQALRPKKKDLLEGKYKAEEFEEGYFKSALSKKFPSHQITVSCEEVQRNYTHVWVKLGVKKE